MQFLVYLKRPALAPCEAEEKVAMANEILETVGKVL